MNFKKLLGVEIIKHLNKVKKLYSPEYEDYYLKNITPLVENKMKEIQSQIDELEATKHRLYYHVTYPASERELKELLLEMGYTER